MRPHYYNDNDPKACAWTRELIRMKLIPDGEVDERSIADVSPDDLKGFVQCHFFNGISGWGLAQLLAGFPDDRPIWTGSCPCFPAGTLVITSDGYKPIEEVAVGDKVLTHAGRFMPVTHTGSEMADCVTVKGQGHWGIVCTPNHPFYVQSNGDPRWCQAKDLKGERWATVAQVPSIPVPLPTPPRSGCFFDKKNRKFRAKGEKGGRSVYLGLHATIEEAVAARRAAVKSGKISVRGADGVDMESVGFARFLGYWVGDGWVCRNSIFLCGSKDDRGLLNKIFSDARLPSKARLERTSSRIRCGSKHLATWLRKHFGEQAHGKRLPVWIHGMPLDYRRAFLEGYLVADGSEEKQSRGDDLVKTFSTVSRALAVGMRILLNQTGVSASIRRIVNRRKRVVIENRIMNERPYYRGIAYETARSFEFSGIHGWGLVRSVKPAGVHRVYNLAIEGDESYTADGLVVHNCQPFSHAGKQLGEADKRHLWPVFAGLIAACRPPLVMGEQVASAPGRTWMSNVRRDLELAGYAVAALDLSASSAGAPHVRQRLYWAAFLEKNMEESRCTTSMEFQQRLNAAIRRHLTPDRHAQEYSHKWKEWKLEEGGPILAIRAGNSHSPCQTGWPTPDAQAFNASADLKTHMERRERLKEKWHNGNGAGLTLGIAAQLAGWPTPQTAEPGGPERPSRAATNRKSEYLGRAAEKWLAGWSTPDATNRVRDEETLAKCLAFRKRNANQNSVPLYLAEQARLAGWATPVEGDSRKVKPFPDAPQPALAYQAQLAQGTSGWPTPTSLSFKDSHQPGNSRSANRTVELVSGTTSGSSPAATDGRGVLNAAHSRWLQGYPREWCLAAIRAYRAILTSTRRRKRGS